jgi:hypothetical protein
MSRSGDSIAFQPSSTSSTVFAKLSASSSGMVNNDLSAILRPSHRPHRACAPSRQGGKAENASAAMRGLNGAVGREGRPGSQICFPNAGKAPSARRLALTPTEIEIGRQGPRCGLGRRLFHCRKFDGRWGRYPCLGRRALERAWRRFCLRSHLTPAGERNGRPGPASAPLAGVSWRASAARQRVETPAAAGREAG